MRVTLRHSARSETGARRDTVSNRVRVVVMLVLLSLLVSPMAAPAGSAQRLNRDNGAISNSQGRMAGLARLYKSVQASLTLFGNWLVNHKRTETTNPTPYYPVAAFLAPPPLVIDAPTNLSVTATASTAISLSWTAPSGVVAQYRIERSQSVSGPFLSLATPTGTGTTYTDNTVSNANAYLYRVRAIDSGSSASAPSNIAVGTAISFQFTVLQGQIIKAQHVNDLRTAVNAMRAVANLTPANWTRNPLTGLVVQANDILELRNRLAEALSALNISVGAYTDATLSTGTTGTVIKAVHLEELQTRSTRGRSNSSDPDDSDDSTARLDPLNETGGDGENPLSRNFNWSVPLVSLPGRAGMDLGLSLSYNSLVWTKRGTSISFDLDNSFPGPGFRLGFPVIQPNYFNSEVGKFAFLLINPDGSRTELRQVGTSSLYQAAESSYLLLDSSTMILRSGDGTQLRYVSMGNEFNCTEIKDRNGNYLTVNYTPLGRIDTVVDTLKRVIKFNYDVNGWLVSITQLWNKGTATHTWASFTYANTTIQTKFTGLTVNGPANASTLKTLAKVTLADGSHYDFSYTSWGQVWKVSSFAPDNHLLNYRSYNLPLSDTLAHTDCPRFTERRDWAQYWNGDTDGTTAAIEEAVTAFAVPTSATWTMPDEASKTGMRAQVTTPDGVSSIIYFIGQPGTSTGWQRGLPALINTIDKSGSLQRQSMTTWTQDDTSVSYPTNPRVTETNIYDPAKNRARVQLTYQKFTFANGTSCDLPRDVYEYAADAETILRTTRTDYNTNASYVNRWIIGLVSEKKLYEGDANIAGVLMSKVGFNYDEAGSVTGTDAPVQQDASGYPITFVTGRGNVSSVKRYDVTNTAQFTTTSSKYNIAGAVVSTTDALSHETKISYSDSFSDGDNLRKTFAYPKSITDPDGYTSTSKYNFDFGAVTSVQTPKPNTTEKLAGPEQSFSFDTLGRLQKITNLANSAYTRFTYSTNGIQVDTYTTIEAGKGEAHSFQVVDGHGRVVASAVDHPGVTGRMSGQRFMYDAMGRAIKTSNPTETLALGLPSDWEASGDDEEAGWVFVTQTYDWKGRPLVTTNRDGSTRTVSYVGCGCAGGEVVTLTDEGTLDAGTTKRRQKKLYSDVLGRPVKTEVLNWQGGSVYSATVTTYNALDQVKKIREYVGAEGSVTFQDTTKTYDGYGRLQSEHVPEQTVGKDTFWTYNNDDTVESITDARGASETFEYNNRHLTTRITYLAPTGISVPADAIFAYDAVGNRTSMTDGLGSVSYTTDELSQITKESRSFDGVGTFTLNYAYNLGGQLTSITDPFGAQVGYTHDSIGRLSSVTGSNFAGVTSYASDFQYRAWGALKSLTYGNFKTLSLSYDSTLNVSTYEVPGVMKKSYEYYEDGRLKFTQDQLTSNSKFDRLYKYDHLGRTTIALSGAEARGQTSTDDRPYNETMAYDALGHLTSRQVRIWNRSDSTGIETYVNNRRQFWNYDDDGRLTSSSNGSYTYDAAGNIASFGDWDPYNTIQEFDGDGLRAKVTLQHRDPETNQDTTEKVTYFVRSSVLGLVLSEVSAQGAKDRSFVYAGGEILAIQNAQGGHLVVTWEHHDSSNASYRATRVDSFLGDSAESDPTGANAGLIRPLTEVTSSSMGKLQPYYGIPELNSARECILDGISVPCDIISSDNAMQCPDNDCGPRTLESGVLTNPFQGFADGAGLFMWAGTAYVGDGVIYSDGEKRLFRDMEQGSPRDALAFNFAPPERGRRTGRPVKRKRKPTRGHSRKARPMRSSVSDIFDKLPFKIKPSQGSFLKDLNVQLNETARCLEKPRTAYNSAIRSHSTFNTRTHVQAGVFLAAGAGISVLAGNPAPLAFGAGVALDRYGERLIDSFLELGEVGKTYMDARIKCGAAPSPRYGEPGLERPKRVPGEWTTRIE